MAKAPDTRAILVVAATERELGGHDGLACGIGPVEAAAATALALALDPPDAVLHVGLAGGRGLEPGTLVVGTEAVYVDIAAAIPVVSRVEADASLLAAVRSALPDVLPARIATSASVGARGGSEPRSPSGADRGLLEAADGTGDDAMPGATVEAMEGFAVLRACQLAGVPAVEVRVISNEIGEEDRGRWEIERALKVLQTALPRLVAALRE